MAAPPAAPEEPEEPRNLEEPLMTLANLGRTVDGSGLAYRSVECISKNIGIIKAIDAYTHLHHIDLSRNRIKDVAPLKGLTMCLKLNLSFNEIKDLKGWAVAEGEEAEVFPQLLDLDLSNNALLALLPLGMKALRTANFAKNDISTCADFGGHATIKELNLSENRLSNLTGVANMPSLAKLDLSGQREQLVVEETEVKGKKGKDKKEKLEDAEKSGTPEPGGLIDINGLAEVGNLKELILAKNRFSTLEGAWDTIPLLTTVNLSENLLAETKSLEVLRALPKLKSLAIEGNPFTKDSESTVPGGVRTEIVLAHWRLAELDGAAVTDEEREKAKEENIRRMLEERQRLKEEAEKAAEAEAAGE